MALVQEKGAWGLHQEDVFRSGLVWVEIGGMRKFNFFKTGGGWLLRFTSVNPHF